MIDSVWRWVRFKPQELHAKGRSSDLKYVSPLLLDRLELLGDKLEEEHGRRIRLIINDWSWGGKFNWRGFRTKLGNTLAGGRKGSFHLFGAAADVHSPDISAEQIYLVAVSLFGGVILYSKKGFVHCDVRNGPVYHQKR